MLSADIVHRLRPWHICITVSVAYDTRHAGMCARARIEQRRNIRKEKKNGMEWIEHGNVQLVNRFRRYANLCA